jgi:hypothetical protein
MSAALIICGMGVFSFRQPTVAACGDGRCIPVQVTAPAPQAAGRLRAAMAVRALCASALIAMWQRLGSRKISWDFVVLGPRILGKWGYLWL